jgi:hypothetical protein
VQGLRPAGQPPPVASSAARPRGGARVRVGQRRTGAASERRAPGPLNRGRARARVRERDLGQVGLRLRAESEAMAC